MPSARPAVSPNHGTEAKQRLPPTKHRTPSPGPLPAAPRTPSPGHLPELSEATATDAETVPRMAPMPPTPPSPRLRAGKSDIVFAPRPPKSGGPRAVSGRRKRDLSARKKGCLTEDFRAAITTQK